MMEEWRDVVGYEGYYEVSNSGGVRSLYRTVNQHNRGGPVDTNYPSVMLATETSRDDYDKASLWQNNATRRFPVHSLVLSAFVGPRPDGFVCCHGDGNKKNNSVQNLRWDTVSANYGDRVRHGTDNSGERNAHSKLTNFKVKIIKTILRDSEVRGVSAALSRAFNVSLSTICDIKNGRSWSCVEV